MNCGDNNQCGCTNPITVLEQGPVGPQGPAGSSGQAVLYNSIGTSTVNSLAAGLEETLDSYTLPTSGGGSLSLSTDNDYLEITNHFDFTDNIVGHIIHLKFGVTSYGPFPTTGINSKTNYTAIYRTRIHRTSSTSQSVTTTLELYTNGFLAMVVNSPITTIAEDLTTTTLISTTYTATAPAGAASVTHKGMSVTIYKKA